MTVFLQYIIVIIIVSVALGFTMVVLIRHNEKKTPAASCDDKSNCEGCSGCSIKQEILEKSTKKNLSQSK
jgi:hypothetical protein